MSRSSHPAVPVYIVIRVLWAFSSTMYFTVVPLYRIRTAGLSPLQLVLVGTCMEAAVFVSEIPTGVVADTISRRRSVLIGHAGMAVTLAMEASLANFPGIVVAQVLWGLSYTFTSGATEAWLSGELGSPSSDELSLVFLRAQRWASGAALLGIPTSFALAALNLRVPLFLGAAGELILTAYLVRFMGEANFVPIDMEDRTTWRHLASMTRAGVDAIRSQRVLVWLMVVILVAGGASEAYDRLVERHFLDAIAFPRLFDGSRYVWFGVLFTLSCLAGFIVPPMVARLRPAANRNRLTTWVATLYLAQVIGVAAFGVTTTFVVAVIAVVVVDRVRSVRETLMAAWIIPLTEPTRRATILSTFSQLDAVGQVGFGPILGLVASGAGVPTALVVSAAITAPGVIALVAAGAAAGRSPAR
jgi:DHA3 family tetracycline resistance protein-like MFS transporter